MQVLLKASGTNMNFVKARVPVLFLAYIRICICMYIRICIYIAMILTAAHV